MDRRFFTGLLLTGMVQVSTLHAQQSAPVFDSPVPVFKPTLRPSGSLISRGADIPQNRSGSFMNVGFSGMVDFGWSTESNVSSLQVGDHDPRVRGFTLPNGELTLDGAVDPHFKGYGNIVYKLNEEGETVVELEELFFVTTALPHNLQLKGGQYQIEFGRINPQHPHSWAFVDQPLISNRVFGAEGLRGQGLRLSWLLPTSFYTEATLGIANSAGETTSSFRSEESGEIHGGIPTERGVDRLRDFLITPRLAASFDLNSNQTVVLGASGAFGPNNSGEDTYTSIYGADIYWKWKSPYAHQGFPFASLQAELIGRNYQTDERISAAEPGTVLPRELLRDQGAYAQFLWGIRPMLVVGIRGEKVSNDPSPTAVELRTGRSRGALNLTIYPSEYSKFRVQYNLDHRRGIGYDHSLWFQFEFILGAHAAHKF